MALLWLNNWARPAHPSSGGHEVLATRIAILLTVVRDRLELFRERMERFREPPSETLTKSQAEFPTRRHKEYVVWLSTMAELEQALEQGVDLECTEGVPLFHWCGWLVLNKHFAEAICPACERTYLARECEKADWSSIGGPLVGVGGGRIVCPAGHTIFTHQTWVA